MSAQKSRHDFSNTDPRGRPVALGRCAAGRRTLAPPRDIAAPALVETPGCLGPGRGGAAIPGNLPVGLPAGAQASAGFSPAGWA